MKQIDDIFPAYINSGIGPCGTLKRFLRDNAYMNSRGYEFELFTRDFLLGQSVEKPVDFSKGLGFRSRLKKIFKKSTILTIVFDMRVQREAKNLVMKYLELNRTPDIVVFHEVSCAYYYLKYRKNDKAYVLLFHHSDGLRTKMLLDSYPKFRGTLYLKGLIKKKIWVVNKVDRNIFIANIGLKNFMIENPSINPNTLFAFHNGIDDLPILQSDRPSQYKYNLCVTGTVCKRKGQYLIIEALKIVSEETKKKIHVSIIGEGNDLDELKTRTKDYGLEKNVTFVGYMLNSRVHEYLCGCDIYILMSSNEGLPISILEAMRAGLGVISTPVSGIPEQVNDNNGILVNPDAKELATVFENIDDYDWKQLGLNSRKRFEEEYTFPQMLSSFCDVVDGLYK